MRLVRIFTCSWIFFSLGAVHADSLGDAKQHFLTGIKQVENHEYQQALSEFEASYRLNPIPEVTLNIALTHMALGHYSEAIANLTRCLNDSSTRSKGLSPEQKADVTKLLTELDAKVATLQISAPEGAELRVDGKSIGKAPVAPIKLDPGRHQIEASRVDLAPSTKQIVLSSGKMTVAIAMKPNSPMAPHVESEAAKALAPPPAVVAPSEPAQLLVTPAPQSTGAPTPFFRTGRGRAVIGASVLALAAFGASAVTGGLALSDRAAYHTSCAQSCNDGLYTEARSLAISTDVLIGVGAAAAVTTLVMILTRPKRHTPYATLGVDAKHATFMVGGTF